MQPCSFFSEIATVGRCVAVIGISVQSVLLADCLSAAADCGQMGTCFSSQHRALIRAAIEADPLPPSVQEWEADVARLRQVIRASYAKAVGGVRGASSRVVWVQRAAQCPPRSARSPAWRTHSPVSAKNTAQAA